MSRPPLKSAAMNGAERQARYIEKQYATGLRPVTVWVPDGKQQEVRDHAARIIRTRSADSPNKSVPNRVTAPTQQTPRGTDDVESLDDDMAWVEDYPWTK